MPRDPRGGDVLDVLAQMTDEEREAYVQVQLGPDIAPGYDVVQNPPEEGWVDSFKDFFDTGALRYGVSTADKERLAIGRELPGAPEDATADQDPANRYAAGYLFAQEHPTLSSVVQPFVDMLKTSDLPFFGGSSPELQSWASHGATQGREAAERLPAGSAAEALARSAVAQR